MAKADTAYEVDARARFDEAALARFLATARPDLQGPLEVMQFPKGYSNLTYLLRLGDKELVMRRGPPGVKIQGAHDMSREYRVLSGLAKVWTKSPPPVAFCEDASVLGGPFYVMERVHGVVLREGERSPELTPPKMRLLSEKLLDTLVELHSVDLDAAGLATLGRPDGYLERQVSGWTGRYAAAKTDELPDVDRVTRWLAENIPPTTHVRLLHNDYKYDNVILNVELTDVAAVLDWELATRGDPLADLGCMLGLWVDVDDHPGLKTCIFGPTDLPGNLNRQQLAERYAKATGADLTHLPFYYVLGNFKIVAALQQLYQRYVRGLTTEERYRRLLEVVRGYANASLRVIELGRIYDLA